MTIVVDHDNVISFFIFEIPIRWCISGDTVSGPEMRTCEGLWRRKAKRTNQLARAHLKLAFLLLPDVAVHSQTSKKSARFWRTSR